MKPDWKIGSSIYTVGCTVERIRHDRRDESIFLRLTDGNVR
jgi:hypothetical protein